MSDSTLVIIKVGGSLLDWPELPRWLKGWLDARHNAVHVLIAGGGAMCQAIRAADQAFALGQERAHWLCIDALSVTARLLASILAPLPLVDSLAAVGALRNRPNLELNGCVLDPREFLYHFERWVPGVPLPHTWDATSDSIAARVAESLSADELVLLKSSDPPGRSLKQLADAGYVDRHFPSGAAGIGKISCVNLRTGHKVVELEQAGA